MRTILHADFDAFYASVEMLDNPRLRGKAVAVGGSAETRGVVASASYEARAFGVRSAMPMRTAMQRCPTLIRVSPRFSRYREVSRQVMGIFRELAPLVEPLSLDEAYLDVTHLADSERDGVGIARNLKRRVQAELGLTISVGVGSSKSVAKIASDLEKGALRRVVHRADELSRFGDGGFGLRREGGFRDSDMREGAVAGVRVRVERRKKSGRRRFERVAPRAVGCFGDSPADQRADGHYLDAGGAPPPAGGNQRSNADAGEGVENRRRAELGYEPVHQRGGEPLFVLHPPQAGRGAVALIRHCLAREGGVGRDAGAEPVLQSAPLADASAVRGYGRLHEIRPPQTVRSQVPAL